MARSLTQAPLSILHVIASLAPRYGGPAKVAELCAALAARGNHVEVVSTSIDGPHDLDVPLGVPLEREGFVSTVFPVRRPRTTAFSPPLAMWLQARVATFDVVHVHGLYLFPTLAACHYCRARQVPYVFQPHGGLNAYHRGHHRGRKALYEALFERRNLRAAATIRYDSLHEQRDGLAAGFAAGVIVPPGSPVPDEVDESRRRPGLVAFLGRLSEKKGLDILLEAFAAVAADRPGARLRIAGPDDEGIGERLLARARELGLADRVALEGLVTDDAKARLLAEASVVALPSADESFGAAVTEAMAYATPVVLTRGVPIHADIAAADAGLVVERNAGAVAEGLRILLDDRRRASVLGRNGRALVAERWSWEAVARDVEGVYRDVVTGGGVLVEGRGSGASQSDPPSTAPTGATRPSMSMLSRAESAESTVAHAGRVPLTVVLPVLNEEENLGAALASVAFADEVVVVDSGSTDRTVEIAEAYGARVVRFDYPGHGPKKKNWALENVDFRNEWLLLLDADERLTPELREEVERVVREGNADGYYLDREFVFMGRSLRCFRPNWNMRLVRGSRGRYEDLGLFDLPGTGDNEIHEHLVVDGEVGFLRSPLLHDDYRGVTEWLDRHNKYATWEARLYRRFRSEPIGVGPLGFLRLDPVARKRVLRRIWTRLPGRPAIRFLVWYVLRRGFLDGRPGFVFCVLMSYYEFIVGAKLRELERSYDG